MVMRFQCNFPKRRAAFLTAEIMIAIALLSAVLLPISYSFNQEMKVARSAYYQAVAMELVDGEMELLRAGEWKSFPEGSHEYKIRALAITNLPPGHFTFTRQNETLRLEWTPLKKGKGGNVMREAKIK
jgi:hypothetical protein